MKIQVEILKVGGADKIYPVCDKAYIFANIATTKTLTKPVLDLIKKLGFEIEIVEPYLDVKGKYE